MPISRRVGSQPVRRAGEREVFWSASSDGQPAAAGVYFVRLEWQGLVDTESVILLR